MAVTGFTIAGDDPLDKIIAQLDKWIGLHPQEKVYLQTDKPNYTAGDEIWFKAYVVINADHKLSALSGALNVDLIDDRDSVKQSIKLPVVSGLTWGNITLPDTLPEGNYRIRAYTNWMRNAGSAYFFDKAIWVTNSVTNNVFTHTTYSFNRLNGLQQVKADINYTNLNGKPYANSPVRYHVQLGSNIIAKGNGVTDDKGNIKIVFNDGASAAAAGRIITELKTGDKTTVEKSILVKAASANTDIQFFPEGGNLVNNNTTKIAFKAVGADGLGSNIKGVVLDEVNNQVCTFSSSHLGMGAFILTPANGKTYKAKITYTDGSEGTVELPGAVNSGYSLTIDNSDADVLHVKILPGAMVSASASATDVMSLVATCGGELCFAGKSKPGSKFLTADIPKNKMPTGIIQFTLFSPAGEPVNERLVFIRDHDQLKLSVNTDVPVYSPRQKVKLDINAIDKDDKPVIGSFSVSVTDESKVPVDEDGGNSILANLLLTSDLKGYIEKPNYYFNHDDEKAIADLDLLMLTQGYHRFEWKQVLANDFPRVLFQPEKTLRITGHLKNLLGKPVVNGKVTLFSTKGGIFMIDALSDSKGNFAFDNLVFRDSVKFLIQARTAKDRKNVEVFVDNVQPEPAASPGIAPGFLVNMDDNLSPFLQSSKAQYDNGVKYGLISHSIMLKEVVIKDTKVEPIKNSANLNGPGNADQVIRAGDLATMGCPTLADCLQGRLNGVLFRNDTPYMMGNLGKSMLIVLDGVYVDGETLNAVNPGDVESIELLKNIEYTSIYGGRGSGGVLIITSKTGGGGQNYQRYSPGVITYTPKGYAKVREFYAPRYDDPKTNTQIPDLRSTVYWKPDIVTSKDGKASVDFFNADAKGTYRVIIEGIDAGGNLGRLVYRYKVE